MEIKDRTELTNQFISRVINQAPVSEVLRVYSMALQKQVEEYSDEDLIMALVSAGCNDLIEQYVDGEIDVF